MTSVTAELGSVTSGPDQIRSVLVPWLSRLRCVVAHRPGVVVPLKFAIVFCQCARASGALGRVARL